MATNETLQQWLEGWEAAYEAGQTRISREEAIERFYRKYPEEKR